MIVSFTTYVGTNTGLQHILEKADGVKSFWLMYKDKEGVHVASAYTPDAEIRKILEAYLRNLNEHAND